MNDNPFHTFVDRSHRPTLANRFGISQGHLGDLLTGRRRPSLRLAATIERETGGIVPVSFWAQSFADSEDGQSSRRDCEGDAA